MISVTCVAPINLPLIDDWANERDDDLSLTGSCSFGISLSTDWLSFKTSIAVSKDFEEDKIWYGLFDTPVEDNARLVRCINAIKQLAEKRGNLKFPITWHLHIIQRHACPYVPLIDIESARYASTVFALAHLYGLPPWEEISTIARIGKGSACRSIYGGFVHWYRGFRDDGLDCIGIPVSPANHWPNMHIIMLAVKGQRSKENFKVSSEFLNCHTEHIVPHRIKQISKAIKEHNFEEFATIIMSESKWLDTNTRTNTKGEIRRACYMNQVSRAILRFVIAYNKKVQATRVAVSFDLQPNPFLYLLEEHVEHFVAYLRLAFPCHEDIDDYRYILGVPINKNCSISPTLLIEEQKKDSICYMIHTTIGDGPKIVSEEEESIMGPDGSPRTQ